MPKSKSKIPPTKNAKASPPAKKAEVVPMKKTKSKKEPEENVEVPEDDKKLKKKPKRQFKILPESIEPKVDTKVKGFPADGGQYTGSTPLQAGKKAFTTICRKCPIPGGGESAFHFSIQEITEGSKKSTFTYDGIRKKLDKPQTIKKKGKEFEVRYKPFVKASKAKPKEKKRTRAVHTEEEVPKPTKKKEIHEPVAVKDPKVSSDEEEEVSEKSEDEEVKLEGE